MAKMKIYILSECKQSWYHGKHRLGAICKKKNYIFAMRSPLRILGQPVLQAVLNKTASPLIKVHKRIIKANRKSVYFFFFPL